MIRSYLKSSLRFLLKNKTFTAINVLGLAAGTLCCLYILCYVAEQYSYDRHHQRSADIYRVTTSIQMTGDKNNMATASPPIAPAIKHDFPEVQQFTRVIPTLGVGKHLLRYKDNSFYERDALMVDSTFFDIFTYHFVYGNAATALKEPSTIVLTKPVAERLFGAENPVGKLVQLDNAWSKQDMKVSAVIDDSPGRSHIEASFFICINGYGNEFRDLDVWSGQNFTYSYVKLAPGASAAALEAKLPAFLDKHAGDELKSRGMSKVLHLQPIADIHTASGYSAETGKPVSATFLYILVLIAILLQVIACINFMNLSTARASKRAREVGVRKVIGAGKYSLVFQFLSESFTLSLVAVIVAIPLLIGLLPYLNALTGADITFTFLYNYKVWLALAGIVIVTGLAAGSYPAFYLSAFQAVKVLKGNFSNHISAAGIRRSLVVFQFVVSIVLITGIVVIYSQLNYIRGKDLGFNKEQQVVFNFPTIEAKSHMEALITDLRQLPEVKDITRVNATPGQSLYHNWGVFLPGGDIAHAVVQMNIATDEHFIATLGIRMLSGRNFRESDSGKVLINETLARQLGLDPKNAAGSRLLTEDVNQSLEVAGVMHDFNFQSLHDNVKPFMLIYNPREGSIGNIIVRLSGNDYRHVMDKLEKTWNRNLGGFPFVYSFMDENVQKLYETEITLSRIINAFTLIAILISCLGLFGLAAFNAEQRSKEISIRKILGASMAGIVQLLSKEFLKLVLISFAIASPLAWWAMHRWLDNFAYSIDVSWWMFAVAGALTLLITLGTVSFQAVKAALVSPLKSLKSE